MGQKNTKIESNTSIQLIPSFEENNMDYGIIDDDKHVSVESQSQYICKLNIKTTPNLVELQCTHAHGAHGTHFVYFLAKSVIIADIVYIIMNDARMDKVATFEASHLKYDTIIVHNGVAYHQFASPNTDKVYYMRIKSKTAKSDYQLNKQTKIMRCINSTHQKHGLLYGRHIHP